MSLKEKSNTIYCNVMEILVEQEVEKQLSKIPQKALQFIDPIQICTYALNHLPALYASSQEGKHKQIEKVLKNQTLQTQITNAVRQGIAAVQRDPLRRSTPLLEDENIDSYQKAIEALQTLEKLLHDKKLLVESQQLNWTNLVHYVNFALQNATISNMSHEQKEQILRRFKNWQEKRSLYDWGDHRYHK